MNVKKIRRKFFGEINMTWKDILKADNGMMEDLQIKLDELLEEFGEDKDQSDFEEMTGGYNSAIGLLNLDVEFDRSIADDEGLGDDMEESEIFDEDMGYYRIEFSTPNGKDIALADFTANDGYNVVETNIDNLTLEELKDAIRGMDKILS